DGWPDSIHNPRVPAVTIGPSVFTDHGSPGSTVPARFPSASSTFSPLSPPTSTLGSPIRMPIRISGAAPVPPPGFGATVGSSGGGVQVTPDKTASITPASRTRQRSIGSAPIVPELQLDLEVLGAEKADHRLQFIFRWRRDPDLVTLNGGLDL